MLQFIYNIFILPVETIVEFVFFFMNNIYPDNPGVSILFLSLAVNFLILPLYKRADDMQERERQKVASMERWTKHIRKTFKGDERYMMQSTYYRIEGYKPLNAILGSLSLLFQIPFFIAAYHFLSSLDLLNGVGFFLIPDLGAPDGILKAGSLSINVLPVTMTLINIISGTIYTKGFKLKDKLQLYIMALLFLVILYNSPSGLVLYWTCNNLFSLCKNIVFKYEKRGRWAFNILFALGGTFLFIKLLTAHRLTVRRNLFIFAFIMLLTYLPTLFSVVRKYAPGIPVMLNKKSELKDSEKKNLKWIFWLGAVFNTILLGVMIPALLVGSSPVEFGTLVTDSPFSLLLYSASFYIGLFCLWIGIFFMISGTLGKRIWAYGMWIFGCCALINYYLFYGKFGTMNHLMVFESELTTFDFYNMSNKLINLAALALLCAVMIIIVKKWPKAVKNILSILILMVVILSANSIIKTHKNLVDENYYATKKDTTIVPTIPISRKGNNVIVIMMDRAISEYIPYIFKEMPETADVFSDFVYYPNTISFGGCTNFAAPALFGGYEYTPAEINKRDTELLVDKHNEAMKVLPVLFSENGYDVHTLDLPYINYKESIDVSIYEEYEHITGHAAQNKYAQYVYHDENELITQKRHILFYSLFRTVPVMLQNMIYDDGNYLGKPIHYSGEDEYFFCAESYATLDYFDTYTYIEEGNENKLLLMANNLTHEPTLLHTPDYTIGPNIETIPYTPERQAQYVYNGQMLNMYDWSSVSHYHVNAATYKLLGEYFMFLKKEGVWDNTRIILVSDHGWPVLQIPNVSLDDRISIETFNPILLVKDFADSDALVQGEVYWSDECHLNICDTFMTNADVATLCVTGLIDHPVNPFTGKEINNIEKTLHDQLITSSYYSLVSTNNGTTFLTEECPWILFNGGKVLDINNWTLLDIED